MISDERELDSRHVKSAYRAMQILEILHASQQGVRLRDLAALARAPVSSIDYVLKTMVRTGHLEYRSECKTYRLSHRVALMGHWADGSLISDGPVIRLMKELRDACGFNVGLVTKNGHYSQLIHIEYGEDDFVIAGVTNHLLKSPAGIALLSLLPDREIAAVVRRYNAGQGDLGGLIDPAAARLPIQAVQSQGYIVDHHSGGWALAMPLHVDDAHRLALVVGSQSEGSIPDMRSLFELQQAMALKWLC